jgi:tight adherence protein C
MMIQAVFILSILLVAGGLAFVLFSLRSMNVDEVSRRLHDYVEAPPTPVARISTTSTIRRRELSETFLNRTFLPAFKALGRLFGRLTPAGTMETLQHQLAIAGNPLRLGAREFYGIRLVFTLLGVYLVYTVLRTGLTSRNLLIALILLYITTSLPKTWLRSRVRKRQEKVRKGLPDALDMLSVCAEAGLGFDQALQRVSEHWKTPLGKEFTRVVAEIEMGISRQAALRNLADRLDVTELTSFVAVIIQSDELGMSIAETLHAQAGQMRIERRFRAQEQARKIPLKMLFPLMLLILPAMFIVVLGPAVPALSNLFSSLNSAMAP